MLMNFDILFSLRMLSVWTKWSWFKESNFRPHQSHKNDIVSIRKLLNEPGWCSWYLAMNFLSRIPNRVHITQDKQSKRKKKQRPNHGSIIHFKVSYFANRLNKWSNNLFIICCDIINFVISEATFYTKSNDFQPNENFCLFAFGNFWSFI